MVLKHLSTLFLLLIAMEQAFVLTEAAAAAAAIEQDVQRNPSLVSIEKLQSGSSSRTPIKRDDSVLKPECQKHSDCPLNHCCTVGMMRFTFPSCFAYGEINDPCLLDSAPRNFTLTYPNQKYIQVDEAYLMFCPCNSNLICDKSSSTCKLPSSEDPKKSESHDTGNDIEHTE